MNTNQSMKNLFNIFVDQNKILATILTEKEKKNHRDRRAIFFFFLFSLNIYPKFRIIRNTEDRKNSCPTKWRDGICYIDTPLLIHPPRQFPIIHSRDVF